MTCQESPLPRDEALPAVNLDEGIKQGTQIRRQGLTSYKRLYKTHRLSIIGPCLKARPHARTSTASRHEESAFPLCDRAVPQDWRAPIQDEGECTSRGIRFMDRLSDLGQLPDWTQTVFPPRDKLPALPLEVIH